MKYLLAALLIAISLTGCATIENVAANKYVASATTSNIVSVATNLLSSPAVGVLIDRVLSDDRLTAELQKAWAQFSAKYNLPTMPTNLIYIVDPAVESISTNLPAIRQGHTLAMYGRVNTWATSLSILKTDLEACRKYGVRGYHIEFFSWAGHVPDTDEERKQVEECYAYALEYCRANGMYLFVSLFNDNLGKGAYGDAGKPLSDFSEEVAWAIGVVRQHGPANVLLQPVAECGRTAYGHTLETSISSEFSALGFYLVYNHKSRPTSFPPPFSAAAYHVNKIADKPSASLWPVSDTGTAILQLCDGLEGHGKPDVASAWVSQAVSVGNPVVVFYHFKWPGPTDEETIKAIGKAVGGPVLADESQTGSNTKSGWPAELDNVTWLNTNVRDWVVTTKIVGANVSGNTISFPYDKAKTWKEIGGVNANPWAIAKVEGQWYACTFEWLRAGQTSKPTYTITGAQGDHFKRSPMSSWKVKSGEKFYLMVSGLARAGDRNALERSDPVEVVWP